MAVIASVRKEENKKETKKLGEFLQACVLEMTGAIFFKVDMWSPLLGWHLYTVNLA